MKKELKENDEFGDDEWEIKEKKENNKVRKKQNVAIVPMRSGPCADMTAWIWRGFKSRTYAAWIEAEEDNEEEDEVDEEDNEVGWFILEVDELRLWALVSNWSLTE